MLDETNLPDIIKRISASTLDRKIRVEDGIGGGLIRFLSDNQTYNSENGLWIQNSTESDARKRIEFERNRLLKNEYQINMEGLGKAAYDELVDLVNQLFFSEKDLFINNRNISSLNEFLNRSFETSTESIRNNEYKLIMDNNSYHSEIEDHINVYTDPTTTDMERELIKDSMKKIVNLCVNNNLDPSDNGRLNYTLAI